MSERPWPSPLQAGDRVQLAAASSALQGEAISRLEAGIHVLQRWGLESRIIPTWSGIGGTTPAPTPNAGPTCCPRLRWWPASAVAGGRPGCWSSP